MDFEDFCPAGSSPEADQTSRQMRASLQDRSLLVGVDRLDSSKGLEERFLGYERFLKDPPGYHHNVVIVQIAPPSRQAVEHYPHIPAKLDSLASRSHGQNTDA